MQPSSNTKQSYMNVIVYKSGRTLNPGPYGSSFNDVRPSIGSEAYRLDL